MFTKATLRSSSVPYRGLWLGCMIGLVMAASPVFAEKTKAGKVMPTPTAATLVYFDNDFLGPGQSNLQALIPLLRQSDVTLLGIGVVTGDAWLREEEAHVLRFLEIAGRTDIPVYGGAEMPLIRTQAEMKAWETHYGRLAWKGAWNAAKPGKSYHPDDPGQVPPLVEGAPVTKIAAENAASFLIRAVHAHPGQVTIVAAGPLTNIALAVRMDPDVPKLAKAIVIQGGYLDNAVARVTDSADYGTDFNFVFDPEAAHIVLTAPWPRITIVSDVTTPIKMTADIANHIGAAGTPLGSYLKTYARIGQPFWDEIATAVAVDTSLITEDVVAKMDVDLLPGPTYGQAQVWSADMAPGLGEQSVHIVKTIDTARFLAKFTAQASQ